MVTYSEFSLGIGYSGKHNVSVVVEGSVVVGVKGGSRSLDDVAQDVDTFGGVQGDVVSLRLNRENKF
jgi:hypothetical protein